jgi:hypothetical protein
MSRHVVEAAVLSCGPCGAYVAVLLAPGEAPAEHLERPCPVCHTAGLSLMVRAVVLERRRRRAPQEAEPEGLAGRLASALGRARMLALSPAERRNLAASGGRAVWSGMTPAQRSHVMKRRAAKRARKATK